MKQKLRRLYCSWSFWAFLLAFLVVALAGLSISKELGNRRMRSASERAANFTKIQASRLSHEIDKLLSTTETMRILLRANGGDVYEVERLAPDIKGGLPIRNLSLAPDGIVSYVYPIAGNESAVGHNILEDPERSLESRMTKDSRVLTLAGPYELRQGGFGIIGRLPVYLDERAGGERFWGFVCVAVDIPGGLEGAEMYKLEEQGYAYELWRISPDTGIRQIIMKSEKPLTAIPTEEYVEVPNSTWILSVAPASGWYQKDLIALELFLALLFALLVAFLAKSGVELAKSRHSLQITLAQQTANYRLMDDMNESLRAFRHDIGNHLLSLGYLLDKGDLDASSEYIQSISEALSDTARIINTENYVFDAIVAQKLYEAEKRGIHTERDICIPGHLFIENEDWSILFGNALDNAVEACVRVLEAGSDLPVKLRISVHYRNGMLQACIANSALCPIEKNGELYVSGKTDKRNHGIGMKRMKSVVGKYGGVIESSWEDDLFTLTFMLLSV